MAQKLSRLSIIRVFRFYHGANSGVVVAFPLFALNVEADTTGTLTPPHPLFYSSQIKVSPSMAIIVICFICVLFLIGCFSVYIRQCLERRSARRLALSPADQYRTGSTTAAGAPRWETESRLDAAVINAFPTFLYSEVKGLKTGKAALECAVCLNEFEDDETLRFLPWCSHVFHKHCIDAWLASHVTCPVCRANLVPPPGYPPICATMLSRDESDGEQVVDSDHPSQQTHTPPHPHSAQTVDADPKDTIIMVITQSPAVVNPNQRSTPIPTRTPTKAQSSRKFHRSHSTGHSLVQPEPDRNFDRFTLLLPEEVRARLLNTSLSRTKSCVELPGLRSIGKGYRSGGGGGGGTGTEGRNYERFYREGQTERWAFKMTPPFISLGGSGRSPKRVGDEAATTSKSLVKSIRSPFHLLFGKTQKDVDMTGERSFNRLRMDGQI